MPNCAQGDCVQIMHAQDSMGSLSQAVHSKRTNTHAINIPGAGLHFKSAGSPFRSVPQYIGNMGGSAVAAEVTLDLHATWHAWGMRAYESLLNTHTCMQRQLRGLLTLHSVHMSVPVEPANMTWVTGMCARAVLVIAASPHQPASLAEQKLPPTRLPRFSAYAENAAGVNARQGETHQWQSSQCQQHKRRRWWGSQWSWVR